MLINCEKSASRQEYILTSCETEIENSKILEYGFEQRYFSDNGTEVTTRIDSISEQREKVLELLNRLIQNDVHPATLGDIVEDYLGEIYGVNIISK